MKNSIKYISIGIVGVSIVASSSSVFAADGTGNAAASIQQAISIVENTTMDFATVAVDGSGGTVALTAAGSVSGPAGYSLSGTAAAGNFTASGDVSTSVSISFTDGTLTARVMQWF
ncbi:MAG: DUF4402 domain-containing protein [Sneathiella sp.]|nr:DUF4402 domain-containing protein [Sneathiella sp.]